MAQVKWEDACASVRQDDNLPVRSVGAWSEDKLYVWHKYIQQTTSAMGNDFKKWPGGLAYIDLFSGPGVCVTKDTGRRIPGSPLIAALAPKPFQKIVLIEYEPTLADACLERVTRAGAGDRTTVLQGDCNLLVPQAVKLLPSKALTLAFVDPEGLDVRWETIKQLASAGRVDLLILFADAYDAIRNLNNFLDGKDNRLDEMMGPHSQWKDKVRALPNWSGNTLREFFSTEYIDQLKQHLGYKVADTKIVRGPAGPMYRLIYASKHERGLDFWQKVDAKDRHGQGGLFGP